MANSLGTSPIRIDTFGADVVVSSVGISVQAMIITAYTSAKTVTFIDAAGVNVLVVEVALGTTLSLIFPKPIRFSNGLTFDDSASDLAAGDFIFIFRA